MNRTETLAAHNICYLEQGIALIRDIDDDAFTATQPLYYGSGIGAHMRHMIEHYVSFLDGLPHDRIDYDARQRDRRLETDRAYTVETLERLIDGLKQMAGADRLVTVKLDSDHESECVDAELPWSQSTRKRELQYLLAHTVHHYALIAMILRLQGRTPHEDFGVAPSTIKHRRAATTA
ncbi:MAG: DinB family protein [Bacteroidota bacterium]